MKTLKSFTALALAATLMITSCKKDGNETTPDNTGNGGNTPAFVGKKWGIESLTISPKVDLNGDGIADDNLLDIFGECAKDNLVTFQKDGKIFNDNGAIRCEDNEPATELNGTWKYDEARKVLSVSNDESGVDDWTILEVTNSRFRVEYKLEAEGQVFKATMTMKAK